MTNILLLSVGTRNKIVSFFKENLKNKGRVICTDATEYAPALYEGDSYYVVPNINSEDYLDSILEICAKENIKSIISLIDPELKKIAENEAIFQEKNIVLLQSSPALIDISFDKFEFYKKLNELEFQTQKTYSNINDVLNLLSDKKIKFPVFVKPKSGSASININKVNDNETLIQLFKKYDNLIVQEYIDGKEYGVDVYVDTISKEVISVFIKEKLRMKAGETDKSMSIKNQKLENIIIEFVERMGYLGQLDIDVFLKNGEYFISEVNPRFGGGYPHAYEAGCNFPKYIINNINNIVNEKQLGLYRENTIMMKYSEVKFLPITK